MANTLEEMANTIKSMDRRIRQLERAESLNVIMKATTGNPATGITGNLLINTFDRKIFLYADAGWRQIASW